MSWKAKPSSTTDPVSLDVLADEVCADTHAAGTPWLTDEMRKRWTADILPRYPTAHGALMPILHDIQHLHRCIPFQAMIETARFLDIQPASVLDTVSFYEEYHAEPVGKCVVGVCQSIACEVCGHQALLDMLREKLSLEPHETDDEGRFTLLAMECLGSCDTAPVVLFNGELAELISMDELRAIIDAVAAVSMTDLSAAAVVEIVRAHATTQAGRTASS